MNINPDDFFSYTEPKVPSDYVKNFYKNNPVMTFNPDAVRVPEKSLNIFIGPSHAYLVPAIKQMFPKDPIHTCDFRSPLTRNITPSEFHSLIPNTISKLQDDISHSHHSVLYLLEDSGKYDYRLNFLSQLPKDMYKHINLFMFYQSPSQLKLYNSIVIGKQTSSKNPTPLFSPISLREIIRYFVSPDDLRKILRLSNPNCTNLTRYLFHRELSTSQNFYDTMQNTIRENLGYSFFASAGLKKQIHHNLLPIGVDQSYIIEYFNHLPVVTLEHPKTHSTPKEK